MHVVMITNTVAPDKLGGLDRYVRELAGRLARRGVRVSTVSKRTSHEQPLREVANDGVEIHRFTPPSKRDPLFAVRYPSIIARGVARSLEELDDRDVVVHGHFPVPMRPLVRSKRPYLYTCHAPVYKEILSERQGSYALPSFVQNVAVSGLKASETRVLMSARRVITLSEFVWSEVAEITPDDRPPHTLIPGGVDLSRFQDVGQRTPPRPTTPGVPVIFTARRLVLRTGVEQLVEGFNAAVKRGLRAHLVIAGDGPRRGSVEDFVRQHGLADKVTILGRISDEELVHWYQAADLAVTPTQELEGFGLSTAEAMACGAYPLVTPIGANCEVVASLDGTHVTRDASPEALSQGIVDALGASSPSSEGRRIVARAAQRFGWDSVVDKHMELYSAEAERHRDR